MKEVTHRAFKLTHGAGSDAEEDIETDVAYFDNDRKLRRYLLLVRARHFERIRIAYNRTRITRKLQSQSFFRLKVSIREVQLKIPLK